MSMMKLRYVKSYTSNGQAYNYFRRGDSKTRLPGLPGSAEFMLAYQSALDQFAAPIGTSRSKPGSVAASVAAYFGSAQFTEMAASTQASRRSILQRFSDKHGDKPLSEMPSKFIEVLLASMPSRNVARSAFKALRAFCQYAVAAGHMSADPTQAVKRPRAKNEHRRPWTPEEVAQFEAAHPIGSKARLAFALGLYSVQRLGDVAVMGQQHIRDGWLSIRQQKTGTQVTVPVRPELQAIIDAAPSGMTFLLKDSGKSFASGELSTQFRKWSTEAGLPAGCTFHGLRATGCTRLAEAGCSAHEIAAWSGHVTLTEVARYTKSADRKRLAVQAIERVAQAS
jgi:integrase